jgi:hypothetical protein
MLLNAAIGVAAWFFAPPAAIFFFTLAASIGLVAVVAPRACVLLDLYFSPLLEPAVHFVIKLMSVVAYWVLVTPVGLCLKAYRRLTTMSRSEASYWLWTGEQRPRR